MADKSIHVSVTDRTFTSEMGGYSTPINQLGESSTTESVELDRIQVTPISTRSEKKTDETTAMIPVSYTHLDVYKRQVLKKVLSTIILYSQRRAGLESITYTENNLNN